MGDRVEAGETGLRDIFEENEKPADDARSTLPSSLGYTPRSCEKAGCLELLQVRLWSRKRQLGPPFPVMICDLKKLRSLMALPA